MRVFSFRTLFSLLLSVTLSGFGIYLALQLKYMRLPAPFPSGEDLISHDPAYQVEVAIALGVVCFLLGSWIGPRIADTIIHAGNSLEKMSATDKIAVGAGTALG